MRTLFLALSLLLPPLGLCEEPSLPEDGEVRVPLAVYTKLLDRGRTEPRPAPAAYAIGKSDIDVQIVDSDEHTAARVSVKAMIETFEDEWTLVPVLPSGAALTEATVNGRPVQLVQGPEGLSWSTTQAGTVTLQLTYGIDAMRSAAGFVLPMPVPRAAATALNLVFPATGIDVAVIPSADLRRVEEGEMTRITASIPATSSVMISWRMPTQRPYTISRARYRGALQGDALLWSADFDVEVFTGEKLTLPLMPSNITLNDIRVDGEEASILTDAGKFATLLNDRGMHEVQVAFQVPVVHRKGPPEAHLQVPRVPVSRFDLTLPGNKEVKVTPHANVTTTEGEAQTEATVFMPMSDTVVFSWVDAIPEDLRARVRANASLYHAVHAEEGVLHGQCLIDYEITHGETNVLQLQIPANVQVNRITAPSGGVSDWAVAQAEGEPIKQIEVFLDRAVKGRFVLEVLYERLLGAGPQSREPIQVPLLRAVNVHRQRGMVALLAGPERVLKPVQEERLSKVGENQLPAFVRNQIPLTVAHTYKYTDPTPKLLVSAVAPERKQGKFDAQVDTLISLGEVTLKGSATVEIDVKSGAIMALQLRAPHEVNVLGVSGPSLRSYQIRPADNRQSIDMEFTQEMEGQFRVEVNYEYIMSDSEAQTRVPTLTVEAAEVEHGRIAVEALTAVEVQATVTEQLSSLDINELPQQLVLKTTNPILLAYKYVHAEPPFQLALKITRHQEIDVQVAAIEAARYKTLVTRDGLAVTTAQLTVRNSRRQFLRLDLPPDSEVWSVFVDAVAEKPAHASDTPASEGGDVLIKLINSAAGFPVEIIYATQKEPMDFMGQVGSRLPRPDMVVTHTRWDVFLPAGPHYQRPESTLDIVRYGDRVNPRSMAAEVTARADEATRPPIGQPLRITVPTQGIHFAFEKLYATQSPEYARFSVRYTSVEANRLGLWLSVGGTLLVWGGILGLASRRPRASRNLAIGSILVGIVLLVISVGVMGTDPLLASGLTVFIAVLLTAWLGLRRWRVWREKKAA